MQCFLTKIISQRTEYAYGTLGNKMHNSAIAGWARFIEKVQIHIDILMVTQFTI